MSLHPTTAVRISTASARVLARVNEFCDTKFRRNGMDPAISSVVSQVACPMDLRSGKAVLQPILQEQLEDPTRS